MDLPTFTYFADPIGEGSFEPSMARCSCCEQVRGWGYTRSLSVPSGCEEPEEVCPWCLVDGTATRRFGVRFRESECLTDQSLSSAIIEEIVFRTPAYSSWQKPKWLCHCQDACVFHGDLSPAEVASPDWNAVVALLNEPLARAEVTWKKYKGEPKPENLESTEVTSSETDTDALKDLSKFQLDRQRTDPGGGNRGLFFVPK